MSSPQRPLWVRIVLFGAYRRDLARRCIWASLILAFGCAAATIRFPPVGIGVLFFLLSAALYDQAIGWVDRRDGWK